SDQIFGERLSGLVLSTNSTTLSQTQIELRLCMLVLSLPDDVL
ncbi:unnamed protein product, partial [Brassica oleracea var. botrytis]